MNGADKKRILSTPTVQGELRITGNNGSQYTYKFYCLYDDNKSGIACVMIKKGSYEAYISVVKHFTKMEIWKPGFADEYFIININYKRVEILWCRYDGLMSKKEFNEN